MNQHLPRMRSYEARTTSECGLISHGLPRGAHNRANDAQQEPGWTMSHTTKDRQNLVGRIRRLKGQLEAVERQLETDDHDPYEVLQTLTACRGAMHGLVASIIEGHIRHHVISPDAVNSADRAEAVEQLIEIIKTYLK